MEIALHLGAHLTDEDHLVRCLVRNRDLLAQQGIAVPSPGQYRQQLLVLSHEMHDQVTTAEMQETLLDGLLEFDDVRRTVFSLENLMAQPKWVIDEGKFYPRAGDRVAAFCHLFPEATVHVYLAIRNPATFLPALSKRTRGGRAEEALSQLDAASVRWSGVIAQIKEAVPNVQITVWSDEDTALLWTEVLRAVSGHSPETNLVGWFAWYWELMTPKSHETLRRYFSKNPTTDDLHRKRILSAMLDKFAKPEVLEVATTLPGWTDDYVEVLTEIYEQDLDLIASMPGVTLLEM